MHYREGRLKACTSTPRSNVRSSLNPKGRSFPQSTLNLEMRPQHTSHVISDNSSSWRTINARAGGKPEEDVISDLK